MLNLDSVYAYDHQRTVPGYAGVRGSATNNATVTVNGNTAWRLGEYFYGGNEANNAASAVMKELDITAVVNPLGTNEADLVQSVTGKVFVAKSPEAFTYDDDGNLLSDGRFVYTWDGENRLVSVETSEAGVSAGAPHVKVAYTYDPRSRRVGKVVSHFENDTWTVAESRSFVYDGWNMVQEFSTFNTQLSILNSYVWGLDLSGSVQGAGGVGGLLAVAQGDTAYYPAFDGNGNIMEYISDGGAIAAHREYDPFGGTVVATGDAIAFTHWFSTKPWCAVTGLSEYQFRMYSPKMGRWLNRDPIGEKGGVALYVLCFNRALLSADALGLKSDGMSGVLDLFDIGMSNRRKITHIDVRVYKGLHFYEWKECMCHFKDAYQVRKIQKVKMWAEVWAVVKTPGEIIQGMSEDAVLEALVGEVASTLGTGIGILLTANNFINYDLTQKPDNAHELFRMDEKEYEDSFTIGSWVDNNGELTSTFSLTPEGCLDPELIAYDTYREIDHLFSWDVEPGDFQTMNGLLMDLENQYHNHNWGGYP